MLDVKHECGLTLGCLFFAAFGVEKSIYDYDINLDEDELPLLDDCVKNVFTVYYATPEVTSAFKAFY